LSAGLDQDPQAAQEQHGANVMSTVFSKSPLHSLASHWSLPRLQSLLRLFTVFPQGLSFFHALQPVSLQGGRTAGAGTGAGLLIFTLALPLFQP